LNRKCMFVGALAAFCAMPVVAQQPHPLELRLTVSQEKVIVGQPVRARISFVNLGDRDFEHGYEVHQQMQIWASRDGKEFKQFWSSSAAGSTVSGKETLAAKSALNRDTTIFYDDVQGDFVFAKPGKVILRASTYANDS